jgi:hypothetical protein
MIISHVQAKVWDFFFFHYHYNPMWIFAFSDKSLLFEISEQKMFSRVRSLALRPTLNLELQSPGFISPWGRVAQLYPQTLGSSGT